MSARAALNLLRVMFAQNMTGDERAEFDAWLNADPEEVAAARYVRDDKRASTLRSWGGEVEVLA